MSSTRILLSCYLAFVVFTGLQLVYGDKGLLAMQKLQDYDLTLMANLAELEKNHDTLRHQYQALSGDRNSVKLEARRLGYYERQDWVLKMRGVGTESPKPIPAKVLEFTYDNEYVDNFFRAIWFLLALGFYVAFFFIEKIWFNRSARV